MKMRYAVAVGLMMVLAGAGSARALWPFGGSSKSSPSKDKTSGPVVMPPGGGAQGVASPALSSTNPPGASMVKRVHMKFADEATEKEFVTMAETRRQAQDDLRVINRILAEKRVELAKFQQELKDEFSIEPDANYQFDDPTGTIFLLKPKADAAVSTNQAANLEERYDKTVHLKLDDAARKERFLRLVASKQLATEELNVLGLLQNEKEIEDGNVHQQMIAKYALSSDREYRYDRKTRTLYELVPLPAGASSVSSAAPAPGSAAEVVSP